MGNTKAFLAAGLGLAVVVVIIVPICILLPGDEETHEYENVVSTTVSEGNVVGKVLPQGGMFLGIPFSQPPMGEFRWRKPREPLNYRDRYWNATFSRPACPQICDQPAAEYSCPQEESEDCLYLNVWVPSRLISKTKPNHVLDSHHHKIDTASLAVLVWFYGGNFQNGAGSVTLYDGRVMADEGDVIVVTTNYRVAHLGFLVQGNGIEESKGNFGIWDQVKTLEWVQRNIHNFGGNPKQVTIFGQSAGAESIGVHLTSHISGHLFHKSIQQSNPFGLPLRNLTDAQTFGGIFAEAAGCIPNDMICLRSRSLSELEKAFNETSLTVTDINKLTVIFQPWSPVIDWDIVPDQPINLFVQNKEQNKPMIIGAVSEETVIYVAEAFPQPMNAAAYIALIRAVFKEHANAILSQYPPLCNIGENCDNRYWLAELATEFLFVCPQRKSLNAAIGLPRWWYIFNETWSFKEVWEVPMCFDHVCHAAELAYMFHVENLTHYTYTAEERVLSSRMVHYWTNFAKYSNPNGLGLGETIHGNEIGAIHWPEFNNDANYNALQLKADGDFIMNDPYTHCDFWDTLDAYGDHYF